MTEREIRRDDARERETDEGRATPLRPATTDLHPGDTADALQPQEAAPEPPEADRRPAEPPPQDHPT